MTKRTSEELEHIENMKQAILSADKIAVLTGAETLSNVATFLMKMSCLKVQHSRNSKSAMFP